MKKIIIASVLVFGTLIACQKPSELDEIVKSKPNSSRSPKPKEDDGGTKEQDFYYNAYLVAVRDIDMTDANVKIFSEFPQANELYDSNISSKMKLTFISTPVSSLPYNSQQTFGFTSVSANPATILASVLSQYQVDCSSDSNPQIQCISQSKMQEKVNNAFVEAGYRILRTSVSSKGNIEVVVDNSSARNSPVTLGACIATVIAYFN
jgi:hypothetical protein